jgi:hypothetical protein
VHFYCWLALDRPDLETQVHAVLDPALAQAPRVPWAEPLVQVGPVFAPSELFRRGPPFPALRAISIDVRDRRGRLLTPDALDVLVQAPAGPVDRGAAPFEAEVFAPRLSKALGGLVALGWRDRPAMAYAARFQQGRCGWSVAVSDDGVARWDGTQVTRMPRRVLPEGGRCQVLIQGVERLVGEPLRPEPDELLAVPELIERWM